MAPAPVTKFDKTRKVALRIPGPQDRTIEVQYPTDSQWEAWQRRLKGVDGELPENPLATKELIAHMAGGEPQNLDDEENTWMLTTLQAFLATVTVNGGQATLDCVVFGRIKPSFVMNVPTLKQVTKFLLNQRLRTVVGGESVETINVDLLMEQADELVVSWSGYVGEPPLCHKVSAAVRIVEEVAAQAVSDDRGFFLDTPQEQASETSPSTSSEVAGSKAMKDGTSDAGKSSEATATTEDPVAE